MGYNVTISGVEYEGIDNVQLPLTDGSGKATFYSTSLDDIFLKGDVLETFESDFDGNFNHGYAFYGQTALKRVSLPNVVNIPAYCFDSCASLAEINLPLVATIGARNAFNMCTALEEIELPLLKSLTMANFNGCTALKKVDLPVCAAITGGQNFNNCSALETLILRSETMCTLSKATDFTNTGIAAGTGYIYVPSAIIDSYKAATNWSTYAAQFRAIEDYPSICG